jgi:predicted Fe-S protein YdhL (DUF1289 family)
MADLSQARPAPPEPTPEERPPSPCINVCSLDAQGLCVGCLRTGDEIGRWMSMSAAEQWRLLAELAARRTLKR